MSISEATDCRERSSSTKAAHVLGKYLLLSKDYNAVYYSCACTMYFDWIEDVTWSSLLVFITEITTQFVKGADVNIDNASLT